MSLSTITPVSNLIINPKDYTVIKPIGTGSFGAVYLVKDNKTNETYAMKYVQCLLLSNTQQQYLTREIEIMAQATHPALLTLRGYSLPITGGESTATIITDYMPQGSLFQILQAEQEKKAPPNYNETAKNIIIIGIATGMKHLHRRNIIHRDLKPENILLNDKLEPHIGDFGLSKITQSKDGQANTANIGTPLYMAPEIFTNAPYDYKVDVYAYGMILYEVLTSLNPFSDVTNPMALGMKICNGERPPYPANFSPIFTTLIDRCWAQTPSHRPTFDDIVEYLYNPQVFVEGADMNLVNEYRKKVGESLAEEGITQLTSMVQYQNESIEQMQREFQQSMVQFNEDTQKIKNEIGELKKDENSFQNEIRNSLQKNQELLGKVMEEHCRLSREIKGLNSIKETENINSNPIKIPFEQQFNSMPLNKPEYDSQDSDGSKKMPPIPIPFINSNRNPSPSNSNTNTTNANSNPTNNNNNAPNSMQTKAPPKGVPLFEQLYRENGGNVVDKGIIEITGTPYSDSDKANLKFVTKSRWHDFWSSAENDNSWICVSFLNNKKILIEGYLLTTYTGFTGGRHLRSWLIEGSNDGKTWIRLDAQNDSAILNGPLKSISIAIQQNQTPQSQFPEMTFRMIRLKQNGPSCQGPNSGFALNGFDLYGKII